MKILLIDDDVTFTEMFGELLRKVYEVEVCATIKAAKLKLNATEFDIILLDIKLGDQTTDGLDLLSSIKSRSNSPHVIMISGLDDAATMMKAMKMGASDFLSKSNEWQEMQERINQIAEKVQFKKENSRLEKIIQVDRSNHPLISQNKKLIEILEKVATIGDATDINILIQGESGTGKELIARRVNEATGKIRPFVAVNCAALPEHLIESELFGYVKGAFTGATMNRMGKFELANGGDIFLDEISSMPLHLQAKLLRAIQEKEIQPLGSNQTIKIDFRDFIGI